MKPEHLNLLSSLIITAGIMRLTGAVSSVAASIRSLGDTIASLAKSRHPETMIEDSGPQPDVRSGPDSIQ